MTKITLSLFQQGSEALFKTSDRSVQTDWLLESDGERTQILLRLNTFSLPGGMYRSGLRIVRRERRDGFTTEGTMAFDSVTILTSSFGSARYNQRNLAQAHMDALTFLREGRLEADQVTRLENFRASA